MSARRRGVRHASTDEQLPLHRQRFALNGLGLVAAPFPRQRLGEVRDLLAPRLVRVVRLEQSQQEGRGALGLLRLEPGEVAFCVAAVN